MGFLDDGTPLYSGNPDAPTSYGGGYTPEQPPWWKRLYGGLPTTEEVRRFLTTPLVSKEGLSPTGQAATSAAVSSLPGTSIAELPDAGTEFMDAHRRGDMLGMATAGLKGANSLLGAIPVIGAADRALLGSAKEAQRALTGEKAAATTIKRSTELPNLRTLPTDEAVAIARKQQHLIPAGDQSESIYVGAPRNVQSKQDLLRNRRAVDRGIDAGAPGGDWYDRYRASMGDVTGGDPIANRWMANQEGQWSAGVSPEGELGFALKENNASIAGMPVKSARPAQHEAHLAAIAARDPSLYQLGEKTGEYAKRIEAPPSLLEPAPSGVPGIGHNQGPPLDDVPAQAQAWTKGGGGATGVNDFRWAAEHGFTEPDGSPQKNALTEAQHRYLDYETALAVDRANKRAAGGRTDWTGEQVQAAGWVRQKADDTLEQRPGILQSRLDKVNETAAAQGWTKEQKAVAIKQARAEADQEAFGIANRQIGDFFQKHTASATYESRPGPSTGHLPGLLDATPEQVAAYHNDPRSSWSTAPGGRDAIYSGLGIEGTGVNMRVQPTVPMTGMYTPESGPTQFNPGNVARPLAAFQAGDKTPKTIAPADRSILQAGETLRAAIDAQDAGAAHMNFFGGPTKLSGSSFTPLNRALTPQEMAQIDQYGKTAGFPHAADTGRGVTMTNFEQAPPGMSAQQLAQHRGNMARLLPDAGPTERSAVDSVYAPLTDQWRAGHGSQQVTRTVMDAISQTPELQAAFDRNPHLAGPILAKMQRDAQEGRYGTVRQDLQNLRLLVSSGPGWPDRVKKELELRRIALPAVAFGGGGLLAAQQGQDEKSY